MNSDQKFDYLRREIDRFEKEKSELIMTSKPRQNRNLLKLVVIFILAVVVGNLAGKGMGLGRKKEAKKKREYRWYDVGGWWPENSQ